MKYICLGYFDEKKWEAMMSKHAGVKAGPFEIRPAEDLSGMIRESERRRGSTKIIATKPTLWRPSDSHDLPASRSYLE